MAFLTVLLVLGSLVRILLLVLRPRASHRFGQVRRRLLATRFEQCGDLMVLVSVISMLFLGYGRHPGIGLIALWTLALLVGFGCVLFAHAVARRY